jgi:hypothetical protein
VEGDLVDVDMPNPSSGPAESPVRGILLGVGSLTLLVVVLRSL